MLVEITDRVWFAPGGANIGVVLTNDSGAILIDTGLNDSSVRKVLRELAQRDIEVRSIVVTHGHADHFGGNAFVVSRTGAEVWAPAWDEAVVRYPLMQPFSLFGGADPPAEMRTGFMLAKPSPVDHIYDAGPIDVDGTALQAVSLAGHSVNQMGILVDGVFFCADVVLPERVIEKYKMPYINSVRHHLPSLDTAAVTEHRAVVPGHGPMLEHVGELVEHNRRLVLQVADMIVDICGEPLTPNDILAELLQRLGADPKDAPSFYLLNPTTFGFLTYLQERGDLVHEISGGRSLWRRA